MTLPYRPNVGIALFNEQGRVFAGRSHSAGPEIILPGHDWQMPQGGIEPDEEIVAAARRELAEETGVTSISLLAVSEERWRYDFPAYDGPPHKLSAFRGQEQRWVAFRFTGAEREIDIGHANPGETPEFSEWAWWDLPALAAQVVPFKRDVYARVAAAFAPFAEA